MAADDNVTSLAAARVQKSRDCTKWTVLEMLEAMIADIKAGDIQVEKAIVSYYAVQPDGAWKPSYYAAGVSHSEYLALLLVSQHKGIDEWSGL